MPMLGSDALFPPALPAILPVPSVNSLVALLEEWVIIHLQQTIESIPHYENQLFGHWNTFLVGVFNPSRRFMIIPQGLVRRPIIDGDEVEEDLGNISSGSYGALHESRTMPGTEIEKSIIDFIAVKVTLNRQTPRTYIPLCIFELKREPSEPEIEYVKQNNSVQISQYLLQLGLQPNTPNTLYGFLIFGRFCRVFQCRLGRRVKVEETHAYNLLQVDDGAAFTRLLCQIAVQYYN